MPEAKGTITVRPNGPYRVEGGVPLEDADGKPYELKPAYSLCRCGKSANKPYCDKTHQECGFVGTETADPTRAAGAPLNVMVQEAAVIRVARDGPYRVAGAPSLTFSDGRLCETLPIYRLCRCGASKNKPFCDDTHLEVQFRG